VPRGRPDGSLRPYSRLSRPEPLLFLPSSYSIVLTRLSGPRFRPWLISVTLDCYNNTNKKKYQSNINPFSTCGVTSCYVSSTFLSTRRFILAATYPRKCTIFASIIICLRCCCYLPQVDIVDTNCIFVTPNSAHATNSLLPADGGFFIPSAQRHYRRLILLLVLLILLHVSVVRPSSCRKYVIS
jgi:hypothetical protein